MVVGAPKLHSIVGASSFFGGLFGSGGGGGGSNLEFREYYAEACPHCQDLAPAWKEAAGNYTGPVTFRQVECADADWQPVKENAALCEGINGFPTMKLFDGDKEVADYSGDRSADSMVNFAKEHENIAQQAMPVGLFLLPPLQAPRTTAPGRAVCGAAFL